MTLSSRGIIFRFLKPLLGIIVPVCGIYLLLGSIRFWSTHPSAGDRYAPDGKRYDYVVVFTGNDDRIPPAFRILLRGEAKRLIISPATPENIAVWAKEYYHGHPVPCSLETRSTSTHDNAAYCAEIIRRERAHSIILITSGYHMNRSYRLLSLALRGYPVEIVCLSVDSPDTGGVNPADQDPRELILTEHLNMVFNYLKFMADGARVKGSDKVSRYLERLYESFVKDQMIPVLIRFM